MLPLAPQLTIAEDSEENWKNYWIAGNLAETTESQAVDLAAQVPHLLLSLPSLTVQPWSTDLHFLLKVDSSYFLL